MVLSRSNGSLFRSAAYLSLLWVFVLGQGCSPCHTGHTEVTYEAAHSSYDYNFFDEEWQWTHHPERCWAWHHCDLKCEVLDKGKSEAHQPHKELNLYGDVVDSRCGWDGAHAWVK